MRIFFSVFLTSLIGVASHASVTIDFTGAKLTQDRFASEAYFLSFEKAMLSAFQEVCPNTQGNLTTGNPKTDVDLYVEWRDFSIFDTSGNELAKVEVEFDDDNEGISLRSVDLFTPINCK